ncbi:MAG: bifunctional phosphopantothenoylcysteine decarboxylase/phosphopantothenate--cysteine ligase CoaBC [Tannerellaceae bacterium]|nr:bifunctional phosphopantothenoylcysteine decarboxylase/phosphopantothenate--cysteine ligase CoaBC [Tannerellaceae bacterium]
MLQGKKIILGITGSIAAYKAAYLIRGLVKKGAEVQVVITPAGKEFITPITLSALSSHPVISEFFSNRDGSWHSHVDLGLWADAMVIAPATASTIGKMAHGIADNMLVTTYLSCKAPVFIAPAMDLDMFAHPATQQNLEILKGFGNYIIEPGEGELASHLVGKGRMEEPDKILEVLEDFFSSGQELQKKKIVITAGPTYEKIDPVRFIGNYSSGKMGFALAEACAKRGADVTLITGPVSLSTIHPHIHRIDVESAEEMYGMAMQLFPQADAGILCAAVADYRPAVVADKKIKRESNENMTLELTANPDIAASMGAIKKPHQVLVGFALETNDELTHATDKLNRKNLDFIVLNSLREEGAGFRGDTNKISIIDANGNVKEFSLQLKTAVAEDIIDHLVVTLKNKSVLFEA